MTADPRLIVALDHADSDDARRLVEALDDKVSFYKIGLTLLARGDGVALAHALRAAGKSVFQDWKLHDIGAQVEGAARAISDGGAELLTVHGEPQVMRAAVAGRGETATRLLAVTVLTSLSDEDLKEIGYAASAAELVARRARQAKAIGIDGVVASPLEAAAIRDLVGPDFLIVTPGVRPVGAAADDQSRMATPAAALKAGASHLVIGRPITAASDPRAAVDAILEEMAGA
jgi:orotidine-5'-phosphate decarboxylase